MTAKISLPECWGHRGASAAYPENTLASFEAAMRDGSEGIESDVHVSLDDVVIMFHDPNLERTTDGKGIIRERVWFGEDGMEKVRTVKEPRQAIPTFAQTVDLLMKPENHHIKFNVDVKVFNDPTRLFTLLHKTISSYDGWEEKLAPRILLGLWHPKFIGPAQELLPYCRRSHIGASPEIARKYFFDGVDAFSMWFPAMCTPEGQRFIRHAKASGKQVMVWTVNDKSEMMEAARLGVDAVLTDVPKVWLKLREELQSDYLSTDRAHSRMFMWSSLRYYSAYQTAMMWTMERKLQTIAGSFDTSGGASVKVA